MIVEQTTKDATNARSTRSWWPIKILELLDWSPPKTFLLTPRLPRNTVPNTGRTSSSTKLVSSPRPKLVCVILTLMPSQRPKSQHHHHHHHQLQELKLQQRTQRLLQSCRTPTLTARRCLTSATTNGSGTTREANVTNRLAHSPRSLSFFTASAHDTLQAHAASQQLALTSSSANCTLVNSPNAALIARRFAHSFISPSLSSSPLSCLSSHDRSFSALRIDFENRPRSAPQLAPQPISPSCHNSSSTLTLLRQLNLSTHTLFHSHSPRSTHAHQRMPACS
jgi:hypothetical protein